MVYITGDMHGDKARFQNRVLRKLRKNDCLIVCGDFGFLWDDSPKEQKLRKWIGKRRYHVLFVDGGHDNQDLLARYEKSQWNGGQVRVISGRLKYLCRGEIFTIDGKTIFAFGGGTSVDAENRLAQGSWWPEEMPTEEEIDYARANLAAHNNAVDFIVTHQSNTKIKTLLGETDQEADSLNYFFDEVRRTCTFQKWFFGHFHVDKLIPPVEVAMFQAFAEMSSGSILLGLPKSKAKNRKRSPWFR